MITNTRLVKYLLFSLLLTISVQVRSQDDYISHYRLAIQEYEAQNFENYLKELIDADSLRPNHQIIMYKLAGAFSLNEMPRKAIAYLRKALIIKADFEFENDKDFRDLENSEDFNNLIALKGELMKPVLNSSQIFEIRDPAIHLESITYNKRDKSYYLGSINKREIIRYDNNDDIKRFKVNSEDGLKGIFGMAIDQKNQQLYVTTSAIPEMENYSEEEEGVAGLYQYDLSTGKLIDKYFPSSGKHLFGDVSIVGERVFVSDSQSNTIYTLENGELILWYENENFINLQGITGSDDKKDIFVSDYINGLYRINIDTKSPALLGSTSKDFSMKGIDGLQYYKNSLIAIHNGTVPNRISRYYLEGDMIVSHEILENNNPDFGEPTLGVLVDDMFIYIANSQWPLYSDGKFDNRENTPIKIYALKLK